METKKDLQHQYSIIIQLIIFLEIRKNLQEQMHHSHRYSSRSSQIADKENRELLSSTQVNNFNNIDLTQSYVHSNDSKSGNSANKLKYKYQKVNNGFRLVNTDIIDIENKQNLAQNSIKNTHILLTLNSLSQRIEKLQKNKQYEDHKQNFNLHQAIERILLQNKQANSLKLQILQKKLERAITDIGQIKENIVSFTATPFCLTDYEQKIMKKCQVFVSELISKQLTTLTAETSQKLSKIQKQVTKNLQSQKSLRVLECQMQKQVQKLQIDLEKQIQISKKQITVINEELKYLRQQNQILDIQVKKSIQNCSKLSSSEKQEKKKCDEKIIGDLLLQIILKGKDKVECQKQVITYGIDKEGYVIDSQGFYLIDNRGYILKLTPTQLSKLVEANLIQKP